MRANLPQRATRGSVLQIEAQFQGQTPTNAVARIFYRTNGIEQTAQFPLTPDFAGILHGYWSSEVADPGRLYVHIRSPGLVAKDLTIDLEASPANPVTVGGAGKASGKGL